MFNNLCRRIGEVEKLLGELTNQREMIVTIKNILGTETANSHESWKQFSQSITIPFLTLITSVIATYTADVEQAISVFYGFKYLLIVAAVLPFHYFVCCKEGPFLFLALLLNFLWVFFYAELHNVFNPIFNWASFMGASYLFANAVSIPVYFLLLGISLIAKATVLKHNSDKRSLSSELLESKKIIENQARELEQEKLRSASALRLISDEKQEIESVNGNLRSKLIANNNLLKHTNEELIKHNGELRQFSFMVSHNLRAPVAALKGLFNLINERQNGDNDLIGKVGEVLVNLDNLMYDLNKITNIRNEVYRTKEKVDINDELENIKDLLHADIEAFQVTIESDFSQEAYLYSVKSIVNSILFNLISNGIKYHSKNEPARIEVRTEEAGDFTILKVKDYGIGLDIKKNRKNLFRLYSRFNQDVEGRGIGLYLCKMQIESLGGTIEVESEVGEWTEFTVKFENVADVNRQVFFENQSGIIYRDESLGVNTVSWKKDIVFGSYKEIYSHIVALQAQYLSRRWVFDCSQQGRIPVEFHMWMQKNIIPSLDPSLNEVHLILANHHRKDALKEEVSKTVRLLEKQSIKVSSFDSREDFSNRFES